MYPSEPPAATRESLVCLTTILYLLLYLRSILAQLYRTVVLPDKASSIS
jgi:hypothetical protein